MINIILLAAGNSTRFGSNKLLYKVHGIPMYEKALSTYTDVANRCGGKVFFVTQYDNIIASIRDSLDNQAMIPSHIFNENYIIKNSHSDLGISYSIKLGILKAVARKNDNSNYIYDYTSPLSCNTLIKNDYYIFSVCDQPFLKSETVYNFIQAYLSSNKGIGCICHKENMGNPVIFSALYLNELLSLLGDIGGKKVVKRHMEDVFLYPIADPNELIDLDTIPDI